MAGAAAQGAVPAVLAGMDVISATIGKRRIEHATETMTDAAEEFGAETPEDFIEFLNAALSDEEHQELLARALTIAQDTALRDKRRALGRALASAASDTGTTVDRELLFMRVLADLDEPHIRFLRLMLFGSPNPEKPKEADDPVLPEWSFHELAKADTGLRSVVFQLLRVLERHGLINSSSSSRAGQRIIMYRVSSEGESLIKRLEEPGTSG